MHRNQLHITGGTLTCSKCSLDVFEVLLDWALYCVCLAIKTITSCDSCEQTDTVWFYKCLFADVAEDAESSVKFFFKCFSEG